MLKLCLLAAFLYTTASFPTGVSDLEALLNDKILLGVVKATLEEVQNEEMVEEGRAFTLNI
jgi:hypothetical protein